MPSFSPRASAFGVDTTIPAAERYRIIGRIAAGGMAEIYLARMASNAGVEREVVLKRLLPELQADSEFVQMFHDEARIASQLTHPNIVQIYELGELDGSLFIAMELLRGVNLRDLLARLHRERRKIPIELAVRIACGALEALDYAHNFTDAKGRRLNVVHRDVSPQNIIVTYEGTVKLVDFGVAKAEGKLHQTRAGLVKGKFAYMSPEQINGGNIDGRSDIFALAEVFYELALHRHPFYAEADMEVLRGILDRDPPHPVAIEQSFPAQLGAIVMKGLKKKPGDRYGDASQMQDTLEHFLLEHGTPSTTIKLGRYVRELFDDRIQLEQRARETHDDELLIESMTVGRAERHHLSGMASEPPEEDRTAGVRIHPAEERTQTGVDPQTRGAPRPKVIDVPPREEQGETVDAYAGGLSGLAGTNSRGEFHSEIRNLFDAKSSADATMSDPSDLARPEDGEDETEMPTMMGQLSPEHMAEVRAAAARRARNEKPERRGRDDRAAVKVEAVSGKRTGAPVVTRSQPAARDPAEGQDKRPVSPAKAAPPPAPPPPPREEPVITSRSATVRQEEGRTADQWGIWFFIAGLGALVGAIVYAVVLLSEPSRPTMSLEVQSTPPGARIILDTLDTGATTPRTIPIPSDKPHTIQMLLDGYVPYEGKIAAAPELDGEPYVIRWRFQKLDPSAAEARARNAEPIPAVVPVPDPAPPAAPAPALDAAAAPAPPP